MLRAHLSRGQVAGAYLFAGPEGVGKRLAAIELAKALNCQRAQAEACDACDSCGKIARGAHPDVHHLAPEGRAATLRIDEVRRLLARLALQPFMGRTQVAILDGADRLTDEAANSVLKQLEEPSPRARFVLLTDQPEDVLPTIRSRCQRIRFQRLPQGMITEWLIRHHRCAPEPAAVIGRLAQGSFASARRLAETWERYGAKLDQCASTDAIAWATWSVPTDREELAQWLTASVWWLRDIAAASSASPQLVHAHAADRLRRQADRVDQERCVESAWHVIELWDSLDQLVSTRLIGTLLREEWLSFLERPRDV